MSTTTRPGRLGRLAGVLVAVLAVLLTTGCGVVGGGGDKMTVKAYFADSAGLFVGNDVGILGVNVGTIKSIEPAGDKVLVTMEIDADQPVPADAGAVVVARSVATDRYVELTPVYRSGPKLRDDATIGLDKTQTPVDFDQVLESLNDFATGIGGNKETTKAVQRFIDAGTEALQGRGPLLNQTIHSLADGIDGVASQRENIAATLKSLDVLLTTISTNEQTARTFIQQVSTASKMLADERENFRTALRSLDEAVTTVAKFAVDNRAEIVRNLDGGTKLMKTVLSKQDQLTEILRVMPLALENLRMIPGDRLPVRIDPLILDPLGGVLQTVCKNVLGPLCTILDGTQPGR
ncbi:MCE family protein [Pimelobacter simplex]|uniref:MCE-family protein MceD n=1 Tax=Nocardioides simplex TaxID=2045 RepID=A0A0A1DL73_NOCSI|nr:MCE family protein [Pimelobacter simplex]AIY17318.2 MCE-family protein MceD [Pimelobacter simplex]MCG8151449.1 MCE family protein [Pimelobacter simplex]GEB13364.1 ABC transporter substrate-binding protein [Pimelobacter simplex]SFM45834.1 virulence factor Mce family protein [Pimelobacter simplex]